MKNGMSRWRRVAFGLLLLLGAASAKAEAPAHCSYGYQDSSCLGPQYRAAQTPPTCSTGAGWTTLTPAKWVGSGFTQPACQYDAPPTCQAGYTQTSDPVWNGSSWSAPSCAPPSVPQLPTPPGQICTSAVVSGTLLVTADGYSNQHLPGSSFTQLSGYSVIPFNTSWSTVWQFPTYGIADSYATIDISDATISLGLPGSARTTNTWYAATYTGPAVADTGGLGSWNGYVAFCSIDAGGNFAGVVMSSFMPHQTSAN
ncbi:hypothetical protein LMG28688_06113 [Paraburkholderia caffeinitolerans]|uniref:Uncharacterized protein n=1 Tax=Paraburkholderia caffeinitolerans TaxID=1723730 RepID=A0A6J5GQH3_9BURK|nr:hypothetical protein LMG28688_06113 [Paraburkholderia caffeinitolerans]